MAYSAPPTQATSDVIGATAWNRLVNNDLWFATDHPACSVALIGSIAPADTTVAVVPFDLNVFDNTAMHSTTVNNSRFTVPVAGWYRFTGSVAWETNGTGYRHIGWRIGGAGATHGTDSRMGVTGDATYQTAVCDVQLTAGQYMELLVLQNSGFALGVTVNFTAATVQWIRT